MSANFTQKQSARQGFGFQARLAGLLEMPENEYAELISEIESDPLFVKLKYAEAKQERAIRNRRLQQTELSRRFFEFKDDFTVDTGGGSSVVEKLLADKEKLVKAIRGIGEEKFTRYFIYNEEELSLPEIAGACGLTLEEAKETLWLVNAIDVHSEFFTPAKTPLENNLSYNKIAILGQTPKNIGIQFLSAHWARGLYEVDHEKIEKMTAAGKISKDEKKKLKKLFEKIEFVNVRKSLMYNIISKLVEKQSDYLLSRQENRLVNFLQKDLAKDMKVHPSMISRAVTGRSLETPWGEEKPLKSFFMSSKPGKKAAALRHIKGLLEGEQMKIKRGEQIKPLSDKALSFLLYDKYAISISQRTVAKYRSSINIPGAFHRLRKYHLTH